MSVIYIGADLKNASVTLSRSDGTTEDLEGYDAITVEVKNRYGKTIAQYKEPIEAGYRPLEVAAAGKLVFHLHAADTALLYVGDVYADVTLQLADGSFLDNEYKPAVRGIYLGRAQHK